MAEQLPSTAGGSNPDQLTGWKEIATYLGKSVRTVQRWERQAGLPVRRIERLSEVVFAFRSEIDSWRLTRIGSETTGSQSPLVEEVDAPAGGVDAVRETPAEIHTPFNDDRSLPRRWPRSLMLIAGALAIATTVALGVRAGRSDLWIVVDPPEPQLQGQHFQLTVIGFDPSSSFMRWTRLPNGREEAMAPALKPDHDGRIKWSFSTDCRTETGTHHLWIQDDRSRRDSPAVSLVVLPNPECDKPLPDLTAQFTSIDRGSVAPGEPVTISFNIWNVGTAPAVATLTRARLSIHSTRTSVTDPALGDVATTPLAVGASTTQSATFTVPAGTRPGVYYIWIVADNGSATIEPNSFNNFARSDAFVVTSR